MKTTKKILALLLAAAMMLSMLAACSSKDNGSADNKNNADNANNGTPSVSNSDTPSNDPGQVVIPEGSKVGSGVHGGTGYVTDSIQKDVVRIAASNIGTTISPWAGSSGGRHQTIYSMYQPLFEYDKATGDYVLVVAKEITTVDPFTFHITIHDNIVDHDGNPFTAADAVYSIESCAALGNVSGMKYIESVTQLGDYELEVKMTTDADYQFASSIAMIMMVTQKAYEDSGDDMATRPVGTGPYKFVSFESGASFVLEKVDNYWGAALNDRETNDAWYYHAQNVDRIEYIKIGEAAQQTIALETGEAEVAYQMSADEAKRLEGNENFNVWSTIDSRSVNMFFNCGDKSPMASKELRQAVCYAIDAAGVLQMAANGVGILSTTFGAAIFADVNPDWANDDYYGYDLEKAQELIKASGFDTSKSIRLMVSTGDSECVAVAQIVQSYLMAAGLTVQIDQYDSASFASNKYNADVYDIRFDKSSFTCLADLWTQFLDSGKNDVSYAQICDPELEAMLAELKTAEGRADVDKVNAAHYRIKDEAYVYGLYCCMIYDATTSDIVEIARMPKLFDLPGAFTYTK